MPCSRVPEISQQGATAAFCDLWNARGFCYSSVQLWNATLTSEYYTDNRVQLWNDTLTVSPAMEYYTDNWVQLLNTTLTTESSYWILHWQVSPAMECYTDNWVQLLNTTLIAESSYGMPHWQLSPAIEYYTDNWVQLLNSTSFWQLSSAKCYNELLLADSCKQTNKNLTNKTQKHSINTTPFTHPCRYMI